MRWRGNHLRTAPRFPTERHSYNLICLQCGKHFTHARPARYCGKECKRTQAQQRGTSNDSPAVCAVCGKDLARSQRRRAARYCSDSCRQSAYRARKSVRAPVPD